MFLHQPSGIYLTLNRAYDPFSGRWLSRDPAGEVGGINLYAYVGGDPVNEVDPDGLGAYVPSPGSPTPSMGNDFMGGLLNNLSMGMLGNAPYVNKCSSAYDAGEAAGMAAALATGLEAGLDAAGEAGAGKEFSHWIPNRMGGPRSIWNGNYVSPTEHALSDPYRYNFMPRSWKQNNPLPNPLTQQWNRIPNAYKGGAAGGAYGAAGAASSGGSSCGCS
jgi:RHS repeat-associated protein